MTLYDSKISRRLFIKLGCLAGSALFFSQFYSCSEFKSHFFSHLAHEPLNKKEMATLSMLIEILLPPDKGFVGASACGVVDYISDLLKRFPNEAQLELYKDSLKQFLNSNFNELSIIEKKNFIKKLTYNAKKIWNGKFVAKHFLNTVVEHSLEGIWYWPFVRNIQGSTGLELYHYGGPQGVHQPPFGYYDKTYPKLDYHYGSKT